jgi:hypothetical protein
MQEVIGSIPFTSTIKVVESEVIGLVQGFDPIV